jgi:hypothetical protein
MRPSASTTSAASRLSQVRPTLRPRRPRPLPSVSPAIGIAVHAHGGGQAIRLGRHVEGAEQHARISAGDACLRVHTDACHGAEVDDEVRIAGGGTRNAVAAAAHGQRDPRLGSEQDGCTHLAYKGVVQNRLVLGDTGAWERRPVKARQRLDRRPMGRWSAFPDQARRG